MAALIGVDVDRTISITFVIGAALAAVAGALYMMYYGVVNFSDGFLPGVKAFTAAVLGGIGSLPGAVLGGLMIGLIEVFWSAYFSYRLQGRRGVLDPGDHPDLHALGHARPPRNREGVTMTAPSEDRRAEAAEASASRRWLRTPSRRPSSPSCSASRSSCFTPKSDMNDGSWS